MNTEDQLFPHNRLRANIFSTPDAVTLLSQYASSKIKGSTMIYVINNSREAFWSMNKKSLKCPYVIKLSLIISCVKHPF
jgi:hypothetical protein